MAFRSTSKLGSLLMRTRRYPRVGTPILGYCRLMAKTVRVAAAGDIHAGAADGDRVREAFARVEEQADVVLLAGDLTQHGQVDEICVVADACRDLSVPVVAVLGNHDWHSDRAKDLSRALTE